LTSRLTTSGARIGELVVLFCTHAIPKRSHGKAVPYAKQQFFLGFITLDGGPFYPKRNARLKANNLRKVHMLCGYNKQISIKTLSTYLNNFTTDSDSNVQRKITHNGPIISMMIRRLLNSLTTRFQFTMPGYMMSNNWINICPSARSLYKRFTRGVTPRLFIQLRYAANCKQNAFLNYYITYVIQDKKIICCCINFINYPVIQQRRLETLRQQNKTEPKLKLVTFCVSRRRRKMYSGHASLCV